MINRILFVVFLISNISYAQVTIQLVSLPKNTPDKASLFIAGNFNNWSPNDSSFLLTKNTKGNYFIELPTTKKQYEFKFTLGSWNSSEMNEGGGDIANRIVYSGRDTTVQLSIELWKSIETVSLKNTGGSVSILSENFPMKNLNKSRRIWIYLPQDYSNRPDKSYPVLYMQDGQNLFNKKTAFNGEWEIDETLSDLENKGDSGVIVVGIDNGGADRLDEYSPCKNPEYGGGKGKAYLDFVAYNLKPVIDLMYRTKPDRMNTGIMGSSMGGLITMYAALRYENTFSKFGVFSPSLWFTDSIYILPQKENHRLSSRIYLMSGVLESTNQAQETYAMRDTLLKHGYSINEVRCEIKNDGTHSEWFWKREFADCYKWLYQSDERNYGTAIPKSKLTKGFEIELFPEKNKLAINTIGLTGASIIEIKNSKGKLVAKKHINKKGFVSLANLSKGNYTIKINNAAFTSSKTFEKK